MLARLFGDAEAIAFLREFAAGRRVPRRSRTRGALPRCWTGTPPRSDRRQRRRRLPRGDRGQPGDHLRGPAYGRGNRGSPLRAGRHPGPGSVGGTRAHRYKAGYDAAKAATESLTRSFALEYGPLHMSTRAAIAIGPIEDSSTTSADGVHIDALVRDVALQCYATLAEVVHAVAVLATPVFDFAHGATHLFDGGLAQQLRSHAIERPPEDWESAESQEDASVLSWRSCWRVRAEGRSPRRPGDGEDIAGQRARMWPS
ncbi:SDR family oxidoreductase [Streptomyces sp. NBC_01275]|nr:SDR family oxidoreductase [Streptomyces sp. NBC_01275]